ncbi:hypothetical protein B0H15DRAFT_780445 [Mycena belliarum]|uniref:Uncharacterized protein n=1 Tax=Mycena belliarum TaxID=1033014 RepID=A0AAD6U3N6_9AGAR|nr:hypothetical protein B0H15DRAFT_780445 [Mycena belliae]
MFFSTLLVVAPFIAGIHAKNDWTVPCVTGSCSYDLPSSNLSDAAGSLRIWGSADAITDITKAAGWQIIGCDPAALKQDIRLVCLDDPADPSKCGHLYQADGAVNKLVRLPENCGASAFARVARSWVPEDQTIPGAIAARIVRRDGVVPVVKALALDLDFSAVDVSKTGVVNIAIEGVSQPAVAARAYGSRERRQLQPAKGKAAAPVVTSGQTATGTNTGGGKSAAGALKGVSADGKNVDVAQATLKLKPLNLNKKVNLINKQVSCGTGSGTIKVDMGATAKADASITVTAKGTVVPPNISTFLVAADVTAAIGGSVTLAAGLSGSMDSGVINLLTLAVPGLSFPGILTIGPTFKVDTQFAGDVQVPMDMTVGINFAVNKAKLSFPPTKANAPATSAFTIGDMPLTLNAQAGVKATGTMTAHLTPSLNLGVNALNGAATAEIFLTFDTNAALTMNLDAAGAVKAATDVKAAVTPKASAKAPAAAACKRQGAVGAACALPAKKPAAAAPAAVASGTMSGCVKVAAGIDVNAGASGSFFGVFNKSTKAKLFGKNFDVFTKCFNAKGTTAPAKAPAAAAKKVRSYPRTTRLDRVTRAALSCPIGANKGPAKLTPITKGTVAKGRCVSFSVRRARLMSTCVFLASSKYSVSFTSINLPNIYNIELVHFFRNAPKLGQNAQICETFVLQSFSLHRFPFCYELDE